VAGWGELIVGVVVLVGLVGVVVQVLPGLLLVAGAVVVWGVVTGGFVGWTVAVAAVVLTVAASVAKVLLAGRHLRRGGVPGSTLVWGGVAGAVLFFVVPVVGLPLGFVGAVYLAERVRVGDSRAAWRATVVAMQATGLTILVELAGALLVTLAWLVGLVTAHLA